MKKSVLLFLLVLSLACLFVLIQSGQAQAETRYVKVDGSGDGSSWATASGTLQAMIDAVELAGGGTVCVASGTYTPTTEVGGTGPRYQTFQMKNGVRIYGGFQNSGSPAWVQRDWKAQKTILSGDIGIAGNDYDNCYHVFYHPEGTNLNSTALLDGLIISGGNADGSYPHCGGGGMFNHSSSPAIVDCIFSENTSGWSGGGIFNSLSSAPTITNSIFLGNSAKWSGGGILNNASAPTITNCTFSRNSAKAYGGGIFGIVSSPVITSCAFSGNSATSGGGMSNDFYSSPNITNCTFYGNSADYGGGGVSSSGICSPVLTNCLFSGNSAGTYGGGMSNYESSSILTNCTFTGNSADLKGGGLFIYENVSSVLANCIFWGDTSGTLTKAIDEIYTQSGTSTVTYCNIQVNPGSPVYPGISNISGTPMFVNPGSGDFHLLPTSPCIDAGTNSAPNLPVEDFEGDPRIFNGRVDMGVDESTWSAWDYDTDQDGNVTKQEVLDAVVDFFAGYITKQQALEVIVLFFS